MLKRCSLLFVVFLFVNSIFVFGAGGYHSASEILAGTFGSQNKYEAGNDTSSLKTSLYDEAGKISVSGYNKQVGGTGVSGTSTTSGYGVMGISTSGIGVVGTSGSGYGVYGASTSGYSGYFTGSNFSVSANNVVLGTGDEVLQVKHDNYYFYVGAHRADADYVDIGAYHSVDGWKNLIINRAGTGKVGIGTDAPGYRLDVNGDIRAGSAAGAGYVYLGNKGYYIADDGAGSDIQTNAPNFYVYDGGWKRLLREGDISAGVSGSGTANYLAKFTGASALGNSVIYDNGNVGIGTDIPGAKLDVKGDIINSLDSASYSQTRLKTWGLYSPGTMYIEPGAGNTLYIVPSDWTTNLNTVIYGNVSVYGAGRFSRDNTGECCSAGNYTISLAENTITTKKQASIQFHNAGLAEGYLTLGNGPNGRELKAGSFQTDMDLRATGTVKGDGGLCIGSDCRSSWRVKTVKATAISSPFCYFSLDSDADLIKLQATGSSIFIMSLAKGTEGQIVTYMTDPDYTGSGYFLHDSSGGCNPPTSTNADEKMIMASSNGVGLSSGKTVSFIYLNSRWREIGGTHNADSLRTGNVYVSGEVSTARLSAQESYTGKSYVQYYRSASDRKGIWFANRGYDGWGNPIDSYPTEPNIFTWPSDSSTWGTGANTLFIISRGGNNADIELVVQKTGTSDQYHGWRFDNDGKLYTPGSSYADVAEGFKTESVENGNVLIIGKDGIGVKSSKPYESPILGVVSNSTAIMLSGDGGTPIAMAGRVNVKASDENGPINVGDPVVASSKAGIGMRGDRDKIDTLNIVGVAMSPLSSGTGNVIVLVK